MKKLIIGLLIFLPIFVSAQLNRVIYDERKSQDILYGECDIDGFRSEVSANWFEDAYETYKVRDSLFNEDFAVKFDSVYVFLATWCSDSKREIPAFCKIMASKFFSQTAVRYLALDSYKKTDIIDPEKYAIEYVPTFIFYHNGAEVFRIIEAPELSLEEDIQKYLLGIQP